MDPAIRALFAPEPGSTYLDTATYGLPPAPTTRALREALEAWTAGTADWIEDWDRAGERGRAAFAALLGVDAPRVALLPATSVGVGVVAAGLTAADDVVVPDDEFTSVLFPLLVARERGVHVREVAFDRLVDAITPGTTLVACTLVQMQTGRTAPIRAIVERAAEVGAHVLLDATHGIPFVPLGGLVDRIDYLLVSGYKHLLSPRGVAFMTLRDDHVGRLAPILANWRAADRSYGRFFGGPLTLARDAAMYDVSLAWLPWLGAAASLELLVAWEAAGALDEPVRLARDLAEGLGLPWGGSTLVCAPVEDGDRARAALAAAGIRASLRGAGVRLSPHVYNDAADVARAVTTLAPLVAR
ncbi:MAG TPA: aminotransferase class V-fold PLP-dependent enzyme [Candidatus Sulfomarinibacteraceae bacterium]|nr:aminotransferase class V-fold PLP-dependent enzyme [Candidatus Sulfomarinibacteraceae bacterium]